MTIKKLLIQLRGLPDLDAALAFCLLFTCSVVAGEPFRQLSGAQIEGRFSGRELTDAIHWSLAFERNGRLISVETAGRSIASRAEPTLGSWAVTGDELCLKLVSDRTLCHTVWMSGSAVQLRTAGENFLEGVLKKQLSRPRS
jgi:hypothetical protein